MRTGGRPPSSAAHCSTSSRRMYHKNRWPRAARGAKTRSQPAPPASGRPYFSSSFLSRLPPFTPIRIGMCFSLQTSTTARTRSAPPMLPGLMRIFGSTGLGCGDGEAVVKMDVRDERQGRLRADLRGTRAPRPCPGWRAARSHSLRRPSCRICRGATLRRLSCVY